MTGTGTEFRTTPVPMIDQTTALNRQTYLPTCTLRELLMPADAATAVTDACLELRADGSWTFTPSKL